MYVISWKVQFRVFNFDYFFQQLGCIVVQCLHPDTRHGQKQATNTQQRRWIHFQAFAPPNTIYFHHLSQHLYHFATVLCEQTLRSSFALASFAFACLSYPTRPLLPTHLSQPDSHSRSSSPPTGLRLFQSSHRRWANENRSKLSPQMG
jgi:hypothetical protein